MEKTREKLANALAEAEVALTEMERELARATESLSNTVAHQTAARLDEAMRDHQMAGHHARYARLHRDRLLSALEHLDQNSAPPDLALEGFAAAAPDAGHMRHGHRHALPPSWRRHLMPGDAHARRALLRQSALLFALTLAFLQYHLLEVQRQVESLPSLTVHLPGHARS